MSIKSNILGNAEAFKEASDVLVWRLPWKSPRSDHRLTVHGLCFAAEESKKPLMTYKQNLLKRNYKKQIIQNPAD